MVDFSSSAGSVVVNIDWLSKTHNSSTYGANTALDGLGGTDTLIDFERVIGSSLANVLDGGAENDWLMGGYGVDQLVSRTGGGNDTIADYADGSDKLRILDTPAVNTDLSFTDTAAGACVSYNGAVVFTLTDISSSVLGSADFLFA